MQSKDGKSGNKGGKKKAIIIILAVLVLAAIGGIAFFGAVGCVEALSETE